MGVLQPLYAPLSSSAQYNHHLEVAQQRRRAIRAKEASMEVEGETAKPVPSPGQWQQTPHGRGRVLPRKNQPAGAQASVPRLAAVAHA